MTQFYDQNRSPVEFDEIAPVMYDSILSSEDPRYYQHGGVDLIGTTRAILTNLKGGGETQGGSSISQQYVKNILVQRCEATADDEARKELTAAAEKTAKKTGKPSSRRRRPLIAKSDGSTRTASRSTNSSGPRASSASCRRCATPSPSSRSTPRTRSCSAT